MSLHFNADRLPRRSTMWIRNPFNRSEPQPVPSATSAPRPSRIVRDVETLEGRCLTSAVSLRITDASVVEGTDGTRSAAVVVSLSKAASKDVTVDYRTVDG